MWIVLGIVVGLLIDWLIIAHIERKRYRKECINKGGVHMDSSDWRTKSDAWRKGWRYGQGDTTISPQLDSEEFCEGYKFALEHPEGGCYSVSSTTGR